MDLFVVESAAVSADMRERECPSDQTCIERDPASAPDPDQWSRVKVPLTEALSRCSFEQYRPSALQEAIETSAGVSYEIDQFGPYRARSFPQSGGRP
jgi:hypothetical protein